MQEEEFARIVEAALAQCRRGEFVDIEAIVRGAPEHADALRTTLRALLALDLASLDRRAVPERVGEFRILREVGRGGMGAVYEALQTKPERRVALKLMLGRQSMESTALRRFLREAELAAKVDHPALCTIYSAGVDRDIPYIAMRFVDGRPWAELLQQARGDEGTRRSLPREANPLSERIKSRSCSRKPAGTLQRRTWRSQKRRSARLPRSARMTPKSSSVLSASP